MGISYIAAKKAVISSAFTRFALPLTIMIIPPMCWFLVERIKSPQSKLLIALFDIVFIAFQLTVSLPGSLALFKQELELNPKELEEKFHNLTHEGKPITKFVINKGL